MHFNSQVTHAENIRSSPNTTISTGVRLHIATPEYSDSHKQGDIFECAFAVICDGVNSAVRRRLGLEGTVKGAPGRVRYTGTYAYRGLLDKEKAIEKNGPNAAEQTMWIAKDKVVNPPEVQLRGSRLTTYYTQHLITYPIEGGKTLNLVAFVSDRSKDLDDREWAGRWVKSVSQETMLDDFEDWDEKPRNLLKVGWFPLNSIPQ